MRKVNQLKLGTLLSYAQIVTNVLIGILYTPVMLRILGQSEYGLYNTVSSTISLLSVLNLGFNSGYIRFYSQYKKKGSQDDISKLNGLYFIIFTVIGFITLISGLYITFHLDLVFADGLTEQEHTTARILCFVSTLNLAISFPMGVFANIISAHERFVFLKTVGIVKTIVSHLVTLMLLFCGFRSVAMVFVSLMLSLVIDIVYIFYVFRRLHNRFVFRGINSKLFRSLFSFTIFIAINLIVDQINWNLDKVLLGRFQGTAAVAVYSVGYALYSYYQMLSTAISGVFTPKIHRIVNETQGDNTAQRLRLTDLFTRVGRIQFLVLGLIASGVVLFGKQFISDFWAGKGYNESYYVALLLILPSSIPLVQNLGIEIQRAEDNHRFRSYCYLAMAFINLTLSINLCKTYGAIGCAIGTAVSLVVANGFVMNIYYHKRCNIDVICFWREILRLSLGLVPALCCGILIVHFLDISRIDMFVLGIIIYSAVYALAMWMFGMNEYEKELIRKPLEHLFAKG